MEVHVSGVFLRKNGTEPILDLVKSLPLVPDKVWQKGVKSERWVTPKEDGFSYKFSQKPYAGQCRYEIDYVEHELTSLIKKIKSVKEIVGSDYEVRLSLAIYSNGQVNPGIRLNKEAVGLLAQLGGDFDIDIYCTTGG